MDGFFEQPKIPETAAIAISEELNDILSSDLEEILQYKIDAAVQTLGDRDTVRLEYKIGEDAIYPAMWPQVKDYIKQKFEEVRHNSLLNHVDAETVQLIFMDEETGDPDERAIIIKRRLN